MKKKRKRVLPMPTEEEKVRARLKATSADPLVWAMKSVDDRFPDERQKNTETIKAEAEIESKMKTAPKEAKPELKELKRPVLDEVVEDDEEVLEDDEDLDDEMLDDDEMLSDEILDDDEILDEDLLDDSDILDDSDMLESTEMIDAISASKKAEEETKKKKSESKVINKVEPKSTKQVANEEKEAPLEIKAEDKLTMPMGDGVVTMEVTPMRQDVSGVSPEEVKKESQKEGIKELEQEDEVQDEDDSEMKAKVKAGVNVNTNVDSSDSKTQVKLMNLEFKQKKMMIGFAVLVVLAVVGVMFGVVATVKQSLATEELASQIMASTNVDDDKNVDGDSIDIKDWNISIKIIAGLNNVSYNTFMDDYAEVQIWGSKRDEGANYVPDFAKQTKNSTPLGTVVRVPRYERAAAGRLIWYDDYYNYYYQGPSGVPSVSEDEMSWWVESYLLVKEMLTNADNYTTI